MVIDMQVDVTSAYRMRSDSLIRGDISDYPRQGTRPVIGE